MILDRDGVINPLRVDPEHGTIDSPLHPDQVEIYEWVPAALQQLNQLGWGLVIATNQPSAAKGKTTRANLDSVHAKIIELAESSGALILGSYICFHRSEDGCECRKPKPGLLNQMFRDFPGFVRATSWMIGDGVTDIQAGRQAGVKTIFLGPQKCDACKIFERLDLRPDHWAADLREAVLKIAADTAG